MSRHCTALFEGVILGGFECSTHRLADGRRLDMLATTRHDRFALADYVRLREAGMTACREGVSWIAAEAGGNRHDFSSVEPRLRAAERHGVQVIWDLMHFGWPDDLDVFSPAFPARFGRYARAFARFLSDESEALPMFAPINEMSFLAWGGGDVRCMNPFETARGVELKVQLVRATIEAIEAIRDVSPGARFLQPEPVIHIVPDPALPKTWARVECDELLQYQAWDMLAGRVWPALGGHPKYLDIIGVNFYADNQFMIDGTTIERGHPKYRPFREMLLAVSSRYGRPMIVSETGSEGAARAPWLEYVGDECLAALGAGCELHGVTIYPVVDYPGWVDGRHCENGLWGYADEQGRRPVHAPLLEQVRRQGARLGAAREEMLRAL
jgi:hypothetical protein